MTTQTHLQFTTVEYAYQAPQGDKSRAKLLGLFSEEDDYRFRQGADTNS